MADGAEQSKVPDSVATPSPDLSNTTAFLASFSLKGKRYAEILAIVNLVFGSGIPGLRLQSIDTDRLVVAMPAPDADLLSLVQTLFELHSQIRDCSLRISYLDELFDFQVIGETLHTPTLDLIGHYRTPDGVEKERSITLDEQLYYKLFDSLNPDNKTKIGNIKPEQGVFAVADKLQIKTVTFASHQVPILRGVVGCNANLPSLESEATLKIQSEEVAVIAIDIASFTGSIAGRDREEVECLLSEMLAKIEKAYPDARVVFTGDGAFVIFNQGSEECKTITNGTLKEKKKFAKGIVSQLALHKIFQGKQIQTGVRIVFDSGQVYPIQIGGQVRYVGELFAKLGALDKTLKSGLKKKEKTADPQEKTYVGFCYVADNGETKIKVVDCEHPLPVAREASREVREATLPTKTTRPEFTLVGGRR